jgi:hypothetical protein
MLDGRGSIHLYFVISLRITANNSKKQAYKKQEISHKIESENK